MGSSKLVGKIAKKTLFPKKMNNSLSLFIFDFEQRNTEISSTGFYFKNNSSITNQNKCQ